MPRAINPRRIDAREYDAIVARLKQLGRTPETIAAVAAEFNRGVTVVKKLGEKARA